MYKGQERATQNGALGVFYRALPYFSALASNNRKYGL